MSRLPATKPSVQSLDGDDVIEVQAHWRNRYPDATPLQISQLTESSLARLDAKGLRGELKANTEAVNKLGETVHGEVIPRIEVLERHIAPTATRPRLPSLGDAADARELAQLDASQGGPPSIVDQLTRLNDSEIRTRKLAHKGPIYSAAFVSIAIALADIIKAYLLHR